MLTDRVRVASRQRGRPHRTMLPHLVWPAVGLLVVGLGAAWVARTGMRPAYDAYGWLVWGHQALHLDLNLDSAPSWKPLSFLFTLPYALFGRGAVWLWMVTAVTGAFAAPVFAGRIGYRLAGPARSRPGAWLAALVAGAGVLGLAGFWHFVLIATADPLMVALLLGALDQHLSRRPRTAWVLLVLLALGRPEGWVAAGAYAAWGWRARPELRRWLIAGVAGVIALWFGASRLSSPSWFIASDVDRRTAPPPPGDAVTNVMSAYFGLYELPMQLASAAALVYAVLRRELDWLLIAAVAIGWVLVDIVLGLRGMRVSPRYMFEPAAVMIVLAGAGAGRVWTLRPRPARLAAAAALLALAVALVPAARSRARLAHNGIELGRTWALVIHRLQNAVDRTGVSRLLACGQPLTTVSFQSIVAWELRVNVADVHSVPSIWLGRHRPIVYFEPYYAGWRIRTVRPRTRACARLMINTPSGGGTPLASRLG